MVDKLIYISKTVNIQVTCFLINIRLLEQFIAKPYALTRVIKMELLLRV
jgi:hypothetical protein